MFTALVREPTPNRIELYPDGKGPLLAGTRTFDPTKDLKAYVDGTPLNITSFIWDSPRNRYVMFTDKSFNTQGYIQVIHHMPNPPFQTLSNPALANMSAGTHPDLSEETP
jgi:hypothetical protein